MRVSKEFRLQKADELGKLIAESEKIVRQAQSVFNDLYRQNVDIPFEEIVERMSKLDDFGYSKLIDKTYQTPNIEKLVKEIINDKTLSLNQVLNNVPKELSNALTRIDAGQDMLKAVIEGMSIPKAIKKYKVKDPNVKQLLLDFKDTLNKN